MSFKEAYEQLSSDLEFDKMTTEQKHKEIRKIIDTVPCIDEQDAIFMQCVYSESTLRFAMEYGEYPISEVL